MRYFQYYGLHSDKQLAEATRKILEVKGLDTYCLHPYAPGQPAELTEDIISFFPKDKAEKSDQSPLHFCLISDEKTRRLRKKEFIRKNNQVDESDSQTEWEKDHSWINLSYCGDTNATEYREEVWCLLVYAALHGYSDTFACCRVGNVEDLYQARSLYQKVFGEDLEDRLPELINIFWKNSGVSLFLREHNLDCTFAGIATLNEHFPRMWLPGVGYSNLIRAAAKPLFWNESKISNATILETITQNNKMGDVLDVLTFGKMASPKYNDFEEDGIFRTPECWVNIDRDTSDYIKFWNYCFEYVYGEDAIYEHQQSLRKYMITEEDQNKIEATIEKFRDVPLQTIINDFVAQHQLEPLIDVLKSGIPINDIIA